MSPADAAKLLDLPADASPDQLEVRFNELRQKLEDKIAKAPTPGLKAKYRESLEEITTAFETLTLAADSSSLPVIQKQGAGSNEHGGGVPSPRAGSDSGLRSQVSLPGDGPDKHRDGSSQQRRGLAPVKRAKSGGKEFLLVAVIAVVILAAGGWFVMKTRAESAEKARDAAEAQAEKDRAIAAANAEQERQKQAAEAERLRLEKLTGQLRAELAETKVTWEAIEREERTMDRKLGELKSDLRSLRDASPGRMAEARANVAAHQRYYDWLSETLARHPARVARGKAEELLSARQVDDAAAAMQDLKSALATLEREISTQRTQTLDLDGVLELNTDANVTWSVEDAFGQVRSGTGSVQLDGVAVGPAKLQLRKPSWPERTLTVSVSSDRPVRPDATYKGHPLELLSMPEGAEVTMANGTRLGVTPLRLEGLPPGKLALTLSKEGHYQQKIEVTLPQPASATTQVALRVKPKGLTRLETWRPPDKLAVEMTSQVVLDYSSSTGLYAATANQNIKSRDLEEWDFAQPDAQGGWQQVTRRILRQERPPEQAAYSYNGAVVRHLRKNDGTWSAEFLQGGPTDPTVRNGLLMGLQMAFQGDLYTRFGFLECLPREDVPVGGTWPIKIADLPGYQHVAKSHPHGPVTGKLVALERTDNVEWAIIEYSYSLAAKPGAAPEHIGTIRLQVNLAEMLVTSMETQGQYNGSVRADKSSALIWTGTTSSKITLTKR